MRLGSNTFNNRKTISKNKITQGIQQIQNKQFSLSLSDTFNNLNAWNPVNGVWATDGNTLTTSTSSSSYPILTSFDLKSQDITATMSITAGGVGVVFWLQDPQNWWAGVTYYYQEAETYTTGTYECNCRGTGRCWACYGGPNVPCPPPSTGCGDCRCLEVTTCDTCYSTGSRSRYNFYIKLLSSVNGIVSDKTNINLRSVCSVSSQWSPCTVASNDNINGIQVSTSGDIITIRARDDANNFYGTSISYTASSPNKGYSSGIIYTPGSNYLSDSSVQDIQIVGV